MPLPHEKAAIDAANGARKQKLIDAAAVLDRLRAEYPGDQDVTSLPDDARREALSALAAFRSGGGWFAPPEIASVLLLVVGVGLLLFKPVRVFKCDLAGPSLVDCRISERLLGVLPLREQTVRNIASVDLDSRRETSESRDSQGQLRRSSATIVDFALLSASGEELWRANESHLLGASFESLSADLGELQSGGRAETLVRAHAAWPALLAGTLFATFGVSTFGAALGLALRNRGFISPALYKTVFYWGLLVVPALLSLVAWTIAFLGSNPPGFLVPG